ncbi:sensor histidine kinase [Spirosoma areae]
MKSSIHPRYYILLQILIIPLYISTYNWILIGGAYWQNRRTFVLATGIMVVISISNYLVNSALVRRMMRKENPEPAQYMAKRLNQFRITATCSSLHFSLAFFSYQWIGLPGFVPDLTQLVFGVLFTILVDAIVTIAYESLHNFAYWQESRQEVDILSRAQHLAQLDALRQQVNPHFLFNSLNSLTALIDEDPKQAGAYAEELSSVYRYLLRCNETPLVSLASELAFIDSYYHLLKTRHGDSLRLVTRIVPGLEVRQIPPLTLQLLVENAVKHNVILPDQPLIIALTTDERQRLIVSNNKQPKPRRALSNGVGLSNILSKYQMLHQPAPIIEDDGCEFRVILPLV